MFDEFTVTHAFILGLVIGMVVTLSICVMLVEEIGSKYCRWLWKK